jgi:hypothetical protein
MSATGMPVDRGLQELAATPFEQLPLERVVRAFDVDYGHLCTPDGGDLYVTRFGWPWLSALLPDAWYTNRRYATEGVPLPGATGHVYRLTSVSPEGPTLDFVVKFSRVAQDVSIIVQTSFPDDVPPEVIEAARFNSPLEEFGLVMELRRGLHGPRDARVRTQFPLAIYVPAEECQPWQLGRSTSTFTTHCRMLAEDQESAVKAIELDIKRMYVLIYGWIEGRDAEQVFLAGEIGEEEFLALTPRVIEELRGRGFRVLDNKPKHFILRKRRDGSMLRDRDGRLAYGLVDFELLQRTEEQRRRFKAAQSERYLSLQLRGSQPETVALPSGLKRATILGVNYVFGPVPDGGRLWVVGRNPALFDYFLPDRWRRTSRAKLSSNEEVYRTRTRDDIMLVYRRSRVGTRPRVDPLLEAGQRIREHGINSPFEEVAVAERLRQMGIRTTTPRAIYRTGHPSTRSVFLRDDRRFRDHAALLTPEEPPQPVLAPGYDYYTLWDCFRGIAPRGAGDAPAGTLIDLARARDKGLLTGPAAEELLEHARARLRALGFTGERLEEDEFVATLSGGGNLRRDLHGEIELGLGLDAFTALEFGRLSEDEYRGLIRHLDGRLRAVDCEMLNLGGQHLLLSLGTDGRFREDEHASIAVTLSNFEFIRGLYRPIR